MANSIMFFGPGDRATALAGAYSVYGPSQGLGSKDDPDMAAALGRAASAKTEADYRKAIVDIAKLAKERPYGPGFFAGRLHLVRERQTPGLGPGARGAKGRSPLNLSALVTKRSSAPIPPRVGLVGDTSASPKTYMASGAHVTDQPISMLTGACSSIGVGSCCGCNASQAVVKPCGRALKRGAECLPPKVYPKPCTKRNSRSSQASLIISVIDRLL